VFGKVPLQLKIAKNLRKFQQENFYDNDVNKKISIFLQKHFFNEMQKSGIIDGILHKFDAQHQVVRFADSSSGMRVIFKSQIIKVGGYIKKTARRRSHVSRVGTSIFVCSD
jgi:hypothetical protein